MTNTKAVLALALSIPFFAGCSDGNTENSKLSEKVSHEFPELANCLEEPVTVIRRAGFSKLELCSSRFTVLGKCLARPASNFSFNQNKKHYLYGAEIIPQGDGDVQVWLPSKVYSSLSFQEVSDAITSAASRATASCEAENKRLNSWADR